MKPTRPYIAATTIGRALDWGLSVGVAAALVRVWTVYTTRGYPQQELFRLWLDVSIATFFQTLGTAACAFVFVGVLLAAARLLTGSRVRGWTTIAGTAVFTGLALVVVFHNFRDKFSDFFPAAYDSPPLSVGTVLRNFILAEGLEALRTPSTALSVLAFWLVLLAVGFVLALAVQAVVLFPVHGRISGWDARLDREPSDKVVKWQVIRRVATVFTLIFAGVVSALSLAVPGAKSHPVIWISLDTLRADHLPIYGYDRDTSPNLTAFAESAIVFERAVSPSPWTLPTHMSWLTGKYPSEHGVVDMDRALAPTAVTLPELLADAGYDTDAVVSSYMMSPRYGFDQGFDSFRFRPKALAPEVTEVALDLLDGVGRESFFLFVHYFDIHHPFEPPVEDLLAFTDEQSVRKYMGRTWTHYHDWVVDAMKMDDAAFRFQEDAYDGEIRFTDRHLGLLFDAIRRKGIWDDALIIVTSDHGEEWKDHGFVGHSLTLFDEVVRVPLIVKPPVRTEARPRRVSEVVSTLDIARTTAAIVGIDFPEDAPTRDLTPLLRGVTKNWRPVAYSESSLWGPRRTAIVDGGWKRIDPFSWTFGDFSGQWPERLHALPLDPHERVNLAPSSFFAPFRHLLRAEDRAFRLESAGGAEAERLKTDDAVRDKLRALGYVE